MVLVIHQGLRRIAALKQDIAWYQGVGLEGMLAMLAHVAEEETHLTRQWIPVAVAAKEAALRSLAQQ